ncbi:Uma2 family endonuclease [Xylophilus sp.]|uniref:Uma2 family endonuclease n=1 Tax=Xylophilus sp. TaxID=2653893 RepID=UPI0013B65A31|nr:Uma2 family endonuclease [Xylophilus sp.]KAF1043130.1 MAG: hypothetical protein GAK38_04084 [Xylophilus sp.]
MALTQTRLSLHDFIDWENAQAERHEFYRGDVSAMVGVRRSHGTVSLNLAVALKLHLKGSRCAVFTESLKRQVADDAIFYPDVFVTCDADDLRTDMIFRAPTVVAEVLSESAVACDRGLKFSLYRRLPSLREYLLVDPDSRAVEVFRRNERGIFELHDQTDANALQLVSIDGTLPLAELFDGIESPAA